MPGAPPLAASAATGWRRATGKRALRDVSPFRAASSRDVCGFCSGILLRRVPFRIASSRDALFLPVYIQVLSVLCLFYARFIYGTCRGCYGFHSISYYVAGAFRVCRFGL